MKSRLSASFGGVADRESKHLGKKAPGHSGGGLIERSWVGWLLGLISLGYPGGGSTGRFLAGWLSGRVPLGLLGWAS